MATCQHERPTHKRRYFDVCEEDGKVFFKYEGAWKVIDFTHWYVPEDKRLLKKAVIEQLPRHERVMKLDDGSPVVYYKNELNNKGSDLGNAMYNLTKHVRPGWYYLRKDSDIISDIVGGE